MCGKELDRGPKMGAGGLKVGKTPEINFVFGLVEVFLLGVAIAYGQAPRMHVYPQTIPKLYLGCSTLW
jgi:hypothetical protein